MEWYYIVLIVLASLIVFILLSALLYKPFFKRFYDIVLSFLALVVLSPILLVLTIIGAIKMKGNPFFVQARPGKNEKIFHLIKFRTMTNEKDKDGNYLPDDKRLTRYGRILRSTSLDELPELINILIGNMSIVGPRPLLVEYIERYNDFQHQRHNVRPGLTGLAQVSGRNNLSWEERFKVDVEYVNSYSIFKDILIIIKTVFVVFRHKGISSNTSNTMEEFTGNI